MDIAVSTEQKLLIQINQDLLEPSKDSLSNALYLLFLLSNNVDSPQVGQLIDWANSWVQKILISHDYSRYVDKDYTSAQICRWVLKKTNKLKVKISREGLLASFREFLDVNKFFGNFGLTALIAMSLSADLNTDSSFEIVLEWLRNAIQSKDVFNDPKNIVFSCLMLETINDRDNLQELANYAAWAIEQSAVSLYDKVYLAWTLWRLRGMVTRVNQSKIRELTQSVIENSTIFFQEPSVDQSLQDLYGSPNVYRPSKLSLMIYFDLHRVFGQDTVTLSKEEIGRAGYFARSGGFLLSALAFSAASILIYYSYASGLLGVGVFTLSTTGIWNICTRLLIVTPVSLLLITGGSVGYDCAIKGILLDGLIVRNLKRRIDRYFIKILGTAALTAIVLLLIGR